MDGCYFSPEEESKSVTHSIVVPPRLHNSLGPSMDWLYTFCILALVLCFNDTISLIIYFNHMKWDRKINYQAPAFALSFKSFSQIIGNKA